MMLDTTKVKRWTFRLLVLGIFITLIHDLLFFMTQEYNTDQTDGGVEKGIRNFALTMSYFSFFFRIIVAIVFWKDSLDFNRIIKQQNDRVQPKGGNAFGSPDRMRAPNYKKNADKAIADIKKNMGNQLQQNAYGGQGYNQQQQQQQQQPQPGYGQGSSSNQLNIPGQNATGGNLNQFDRGKR